MIEEEKKVSKSKRFRERSITFTYYKPDPIDIIIWVNKLATLCQWVYGQIEICPETKRMHFQGMAYSSNPIAWALLVEDKVHKEKCYKPEDSLVYCHKLESRYIEDIDNPEQYVMEIGVRPTWNIKGQKLKNMDLIKGDLAKLVEEEKLPIIQLPKMIIAINTYKMLKRTYVEDFTTIRGEWIYGKSGLGKSKYARHGLQQSDYYLKHLNKWWCNYNGQETVIVDDVRQEHAAWLLPFLLVWTDKYAFAGETKGGNVPVCHKKIIITSNYSPESLWPLEDQWEPLYRRMKVFWMKSEIEMEKMEKPLFNAFS